LRLDTPFGRQSRGADVVLPVLRKVIHSPDSGSPLA
jgi:hypothetical protein